ncbi:MAG: hypothetical protein ACKVXR_00345 [Planctomycetota bacterium]
MLNTILPAVGLCLLLASPQSATHSRDSVRESPPSASASGTLTITLWPPNHKHVELDLNEILGLGGEGGGSVTITDITQDEPINSTGDGNTVCDAFGVGGHVASVRAERRGPSNGRVYAIHFDIGGGEGGEFGSGVIFVTVPHDQSGRPAIDDGQNYDSGQGCP